MFRGAMFSRQVRLFSTAARTVQRPKWTPPATLRFALRDVDPATVTPSKWVSPQGGYESLPFRVRHNARAALRSAPSGIAESGIASTISCEAHVPPLPSPLAQVFRTVKGKQLPVYTDYRNGRTRCMTILRRYRGDEAQLAEEMSRVCDDKPVAVRPGRIEVKGNYNGRVVEWLERLGF